MSFKEGNKAKRQANDLAVIIEQLKVETEHNRKQFSEILNVSTILTALTFSPVSRVTCLYVPVG